MKYFILLVASFLDPSQCGALRAISREFTSVRPICAREIFVRAIKRSSLFMHFGRAYARAYARARARASACVFVRREHSHRSWAIILSSACRVDDLQLARVCFAADAQDSRSDLSPKGIHTATIRPYPYAHFKEMIPRVGIDRVSKYIEDGHNIRFLRRSFSNITNCARVFRAFWRHWSQNAMPRDVGFLWSLILSANNVSCARFLLSSIRRLRDSNAAAAAAFEESIVHYTNQSWDCDASEYDLEFINFLAENGVGPTNMRVSVQNAATALRLVELGAILESASNLIFPASRRGNMGLVNVLCATASSADVRAQMKSNSFACAIYYARTPIIRALTTFVKPISDQYLFMCANGMPFFYTIDSARAISDYYAYWLRIALESGDAHTLALTRYSALEIFSHCIAAPQCTPHIWRALTTAALEADPPLRKRISRHLRISSHPQTITTAQIFIRECNCVPQGITVNNPIRFFLRIPSRVARVLFEAGVTPARTRDDPISTMRIWSSHTWFARRRHQAYIAREFIARGFIAHDEAQLRELAELFLLNDRIPTDVAREIFAKMSVSDGLCVVSKVLPKLCRKTSWRTIEYIFENFPFARLITSLPEFRLPAFKDKSERTIRFVAMHSRNAPIVSRIAREAARQITSSALQYAKWKRLVVSCVGKYGSRLSMKKMPLLSLQRALKRCPIPNITELLTRNRADLWQIHHSEEIAQIRAKSRAQFIDMQIELFQRARSNKKERQLFQ